MSSRSFRTVVLAALAVLSGCDRACPSPAGGSCDPAKSDCPKGYHCAVAQVCTKACADVSDCWVKVSDGCRPQTMPLQRLPDGGMFVEQSDDGYCPETRVLVCLGGYCQSPTCLDGGCDYDVWGPSPFGGNRTQGPAE